MKIKANKSPFISKRFREAFRRRKRLAGVVLSLGAIVGSVVLFFAVFNYGGYLYKSGQTQHFKQMLSDMVSMDFAFVANYMKGQTAEMDDIKIDMKFKHMLRLQYLREQAAKNKYIDDVFKDEDFPAKLTYNGVTHDVKLALTGKVARTHLGNPAKWSFEVKVKGDNTIEGMKRFGVLVPTARGNLTDWLSFELMKDRGLMGLRVKYVDVTINGKSVGVFYLEERFDKHLVENNRLREGIIYKLDKDVFPYQESSLMADPATRAHLMLLKRMWHDVMAGDLPPEKFFDMEKMAKVFVISDLMNNRHPLSRANLRFYFNPVTGLSEPIAREFEDLAKSDPATMNMFLEEPELYSRQFWLSQEEIIGMVHNNREFQRHYIREAEYMSQKKSLDEFFARHKDELDQIIDKVYRTWPYFKLPKEIMYQNQAHIRSVLFPEAPQLVAHFHEQDGQYLQLILENQQDLPLEVSHLSLGETGLFPDGPVIVDAKVRTDHPGGRPVKFRMPESLNWSEDRLPELRVHYNLLGLEKGEKEVSITPVEAAQPLNAFEEGLATEANYDDFSFVEERNGGAVIAIPAGAWTLSEDLVVPAGKRLEIDAGARIDLVGGAKIISYAPVVSAGTETNPVLLHSSDATGEGLVVVRAQYRSVLSYTNIRNLFTGREAGRGAVAFYQSPVNILSCSFSENREGSAMLHLIRSDFLIEETTFSQIRRDALVSDFCTGAIRQTTFTGVGANGLDVSGSELELVRVLIKDVAGKALTVDDAGRLSAEWLDIRNAGAGIVGSDRSELKMANVQILDSRIGIALLQEKAAFGPPSVAVRGLEMQGVQTPYLIEAAATLLVDGASPAAPVANVKEVLDGAPRQELE